ncbi:MAG TPA: hypothetical protein VGD50_02000 [Candidatus Baltobacteraceae bacterium]
MSDTAITSAQTMYIGLRYRDAQAAIEWLERAFGATKHVAYEHNDAIVHAEIAIAGNSSCSVKSAPSRCNGAARN